MMAEDIFMAKEVRIRVAEAKQRDAGRGKARIDDEIMRALTIVAGDIISIKGKRTTAAVAWPAYQEDQDRNIIRMDGLLRKNAGVAINEYVTVEKADANEAKSVVLAPVDMRLNVDRDFKNFVKSRLLEFPLVEGDSILVVILGNAIPFTVVRFRPRGIVKIVQSTNLQVLGEPTVSAKGIPRVTYEDIGGLHEEIRRTREMIELPLRHPELFQRLGIEPPKGVLLYGFPGCGKTLLAKAVANESEVNFFSINGPEIMSKFYGESEKRLRGIFEKAQKNSPSIIFIDEVDSMTPRRGAGYSHSGVTGRVISQLLTEMDGLVSLKNVIVIAATNRPDILDPALLRPGRFDRLIYVPSPDEDARLEIFRIYTKEMPLADDVKLTTLARATKDYSGADIAALCREAGMHVLRRSMSSDTVSMADFKKGMDTIGPSITPEMENWYRSVAKQFRKPVNVATPVV
jgi:transitional endoplasmic reticulum ATPase